MTHLFRDSPSARNDRVLDESVGQTDLLAVVIQVQVRGFVPRAFIKVLLSFAPLAITKDMSMAKDHGVDLCLLL